VIARQIDAAGQAVEAELARVPAGATDDTTALLTKHRITKITAEARKLGTP
jgi:hypothetical protein